MFGGRWRKNYSYLKMKRKKTKQRKKCFIIKSEFPEQRDSLALGMSSKQLKNKKMKQRKKPHTMEFCPQINAFFVLIPIIYFVFGCRGGWRRQPNDVNQKQNISIKLLLSVGIWVAIVVWCDRWLELRRASVRYWYTCRNDAIRCLYRVCCAVCFFSVCFLFVVELVLWILCAL